MRKSTTKTTAAVSPAARVFAASERINQMLIAQLDPAQWASPAPGKVRTIAAIFSHMHNVRCKWVRLTAPQLGVPAQLHRAHCSPHQASAALAESALRCIQMLEEAMGSDPERIAMFRRDSWAAAWPAGTEMLSYMISHEAHHRGQVCMLAHQLGHPLTAAATSDLWNWEKIWKELGFGSPAR